MNCPQFIYLPEHAVTNASHGIFLQANSPTLRPQGQSVTVNGYPNFGKTHIFYLDVARQVLALGQ